MVRLTGEFASLYPEFILYISVDDKAALIIGIPLQHRLSQLGIYPVGQGPNYHDHDIRSGMSLANHGYLVLEQKKNTLDQEEQEDITLDEAPEEHLAEWNIEEDYTEDLPPGLTVVESDDESELDLDGADELAEELVAGKYLDGLEDEFCTEVDNEAIYGEKYRNLREQLSGKADEEGQREKEPKNLVQLDGADDNSDSESDYEFCFQPRPSRSTKQPPQCTPLSHRSKRLRRSKNPSYMDPSSSSSECDGEQGLQGGEAEQVEEVAVGIHEEERRQQVQEDQEQADREQRRQGGIAAISGLRGQRGGGGAAAAFDEPPLPSQQVPEDQEQVDREQRHQGGIAAEEIDQVERRHQGQRDQERAAASDSGFTGWSLLLGRKHHCWFRPH